MGGGKDGRERVRGAEREGREREGGVEGEEGEREEGGMEHYRRYTFTLTRTTWLY